MWIAIASTTTATPTQQQQNNINSKTTPVVCIFWNYMLNHMQECVFSWICCSYTTEESSLAAFFLTEIHINLSVSNKFKYFWHVFYGATRLLFAITSFELTRIVVHFAFASGNLYFPFKEFPPLIIRVQVGECEDGHRKWIYGARLFGDPCSISFARSSLMKPNANVIFIYFFFGRERGVECKNELDQKPMRLVSSVLTVM